MITMFCSGGADLVIETLPDGTLSIHGSAEIPPYPDAGRWIDNDTKSTIRFITRHFLYTIPGQSPALELFIITDRSGEPPDGVFETSMIRSFLAAFGKEIGFKYEAPAFSNAIIGFERAGVRVELSDGNRSIWLYAYVYLRQPSLVFLTVRSRGDAQLSIEDYLATVRFR